jgi:hypothetical protein
MAVKGKQPIKWILYCWLKAIGQDDIQLVDWYIHEKPLAGNSKGAVNVRAPSKYWGGQGNSWKSYKLSGYLTKYIPQRFREFSQRSKVLLAYKGHRTD